MWGSGESLNRAIGTSVSLPTPKVSVSHFRSGYSFPYVSVSQVSGVPDIRYGDGGQIRTLTARGGGGRSGSVTQCKCNQDSEGGKCSREKRTRNNPRGAMPQWPWTGP